MDGKVEQTHQEEVYSTPQRRGGIINTLYPPGPQGGIKARARNHCRKFWWCDLLLFIVGTLVITLPLIYVGIPHMAQHDINTSTLEVLSQEATNPGADSMSLELKTVIKSGSSYHPIIDGFRAALSLAGQQPFVYIDIPQAKSEKATYVTVNQDVQFANNDSFAAYTKAVLNSETFQVHLDGKTKLKLQGLDPLSVNYNKVVTMKGLNKLSGLNITDIKIILNQTDFLSDGSNMVGTAIIPNPSVMTLDLGNVTMNLAVDGKAIGTSLLPNLLLTPGNNTYPMQAIVNQQILLGLISTNYTNGIIPVDISGNSSVKNGVHLTYYEEAIKSNTIRLDLNVQSALAAIGLNIK